MFPPVDGQPVIHAASAFSGRLFPRCRLLRCRKKFALLSIESYVSFDLQRFKLRQSHAVGQEAGILPCIGPLSGCRQEPSLHTQAFAADFQPLTEPGPRLDQCLVRHFHCGPANYGVSVEGQQPVTPKDLKHVLQRPLVAGCRCDLGTPNAPPGVLRPPRPGSPGARRVAVPPVSPQRQGSGRSLRLAAIQPRHPADLQIPGKGHEVPYPLTEHLGQRILKQR